MSGTRTRWRLTPPQAWYLAFAFLTQIASWVVTSTLPWYALQGSEGIRALALVQSLQFLPSLLLAPVAGTWADRVRPSVLLRWTTVTNVLALGGVALVGGSRSGGAVLAVALLAGLTTATSIFQFSAVQVLIGSIVGDDDRARLMGVSASLGSVSRVVGPALSAALLVFGGARAAFAGALVAAALALVALAPLRRVEVFDAGRPRTRFVDGLRYVRQQPVLRRELLTFTVVSLVVLNIGTLVPLAVDTWYGNDPRVLGAANVALGVGALGGGLLLASAKAHLAVARPVALGAVAAAAALLAVTGRVLVPFVVILVVLGCARLVYTTTVQVAVVTGTTAEHRGKVAALYGMAFNGTTSLGSLLTAAVVAWGGVVAGLLLAGAVSVGAAAAPRVADRRAARPEQAVEHAQGTSG